MLVLRVVIPERVFVAQGVTPEGDSGREGVFDTGGWLTIVLGEPLHVGDKNAASGPV